MKRVIKRKSITIKKIVQNGADRQENHRPDFQHCPNCDHPMDNSEWDKAATILILNPRCYKAGCVAIFSECPKCFHESWVHERMGGFDWNEAWPENWKVEVKKLEDAVKLAALREWGEGICHKCKHLESGDVEYHAWRTCIVGSGPAMKECPKFKLFSKST